MNPPLTNVANCEYNSPLSISTYNGVINFYAAYIPYIPCMQNYYCLYNYNDKKSMVVGQRSALYCMHIQVFCMITIIAYHQVFIAKIAGYQKGVGDHRVDQ